MDMNKTLQPTVLEFIARLTDMIRANIGKLDFEFRIHQVNAIVAAIENDCGLFDMTCGLGKTLIQACIIYWNLLEKKKEGKPFKCLWVCHRLMLEKQVKAVFEAYFGEDFYRDELQNRRTELGRRFRIQEDGERRHGRRGRLQRKSTLRPRHPSTNT